MRIEVPSFLRRGVCAEEINGPFLNGADGVVGKFEKIGAEIYKVASRPYQPPRPLP